MDFLFLLCGGSQLAGMKIPHVWKKGINKSQTTSGPKMWSTNKEQSNGIITLAQILTLPSRSGCLTVTPTALQMSYTASTATIILTLLHPSVWSIVPCFSRHTKPSKSKGIGYKEVSIFCVCGGRQLAADLAVDMNFTTISTKKGIACTWEEKVTLWWELLLFPLSVLGRYVWLHWHVRLPW